MVLIEAKGIKKFFGERRILEFEQLKIEHNDRIGIVGENGVGKSTLIKILSQKIQVDEGYVKTKGKVGYISQFEGPSSQHISYEMASKFNVSADWDASMSGGEKTKFKIAAALDASNTIIFADEPTSNMDLASISTMEYFFTTYEGALVIISHDRTLLDRLCNQIIEIEDGHIIQYNGNYTAYREQEEHQRQYKAFEYQKYIDEKKRLERVVDQTKAKAKKVRNAPKRMGNSEARLHKMGGQKAKANLSKAAKNVRTRIEHLERKEKPQEQKKIKLDIIETSRSYSKILIEGNGIDKAFGEKMIFRDANFRIENGEKVALLGPNGSGKSTLIKMILNKEEGIYVAPTAKIGYFNQALDILETDKTILENVMQSSVYPENIVRLFLARLLLRGDSVYKPVQTLSGGERVKVSFAKILLDDFNMLILDEPTNYLDISSLEVIEEAIADFDRTVLFVSHDRQFVDTIATVRLTIQQHQIVKE